MELPQLTNGTLLQYINHQHQGDHARMINALYGIYGIDNNKNPASSFVSQGWIHPALRNQPLLSLWAAAKRDALYLYLLLSRCCRSSTKFQCNESRNKNNMHLYSWFGFHFLSGLSLALNKEGCDWQDRHSARANSGRATHLSQTRYTPLVEVNQAIKAWSF